MAFTNQFSLSLELTKLVPFGSLLTSAGRGMLHLMRELQDSGSDIITEADLAQIFGRNRIEPRFASTFRTAVAKSVIHKISDIAELVIEAGAGPTVKRSLNDPAYFSTVLQLSLLTYTHDLSQLARCLAKAFEKRAEGATEPVGLPRHDALKGALRACREQTSGFMWELFLIPVEKKLAHITGADGPFIPREIPVPVLQALLDSFTAVQYLPENRFIRIDSFSGLVSIVVWAHHVLGLTVCVDGYDSDLVRFGDGFESVYISARMSQSSEPKASLLNETKDLIFQVVASNEDLPLDATCRHTVLGYGARDLELQKFDENTIEVLVRATVSTCIGLVQLESKRRASNDGDQPVQNFYPSVQRVLTVGRMLVPYHGTVFDSLDLNAEHPISASWLSGLPEKGKGPGFSRDSKRLSTWKLSYLLLVLSMVENVDDCAMLSLDLYCLSKEHYMPLRLPHAHEAFECLALLLQGRALHNEDAEIRDIAVFSAWGWSLCVSSVVGSDPSEIRSGIVVLQGVPMREGERKRLIIDCIGKEYTRTRRDEKFPGYTAIAGPGEKIALSSRTRPRKTRYFMSVTDSAFEVAKFLSSELVDSGDISR